MQNYDRCSKLLREEWGDLTSKTNYIIFAEINGPISSADQISNTSHPWGKNITNDFHL